LPAAIAVPIVREDASALTNGLTHALTNGLTHALTNGLTNALTNGLTHALTHALTNALTNAFTNGLTYALTNALTHVLCTVTLRLSLENVFSCKHTSPHSNTLQYPATPCNTLQHMHTDALANALTCAL